MMGSTAPFMVIETDILLRGIWSKRTFMSSTEQIGLNLAGTMSNSDVTNTDSSTGYVNPFYFARNIGPIYPIHQHNADGSFVLDESWSSTPWLYIVPTFCHWLV